VLAATIVAVGCFELSTDPDEIVAIEFAEFPWPSIVAGDTLRDATGAVTPLVVRLFGGDGDVVVGDVEFLTLKSSIRVVAGDLLVADDTATGQAGLFASTSGIQSIVRQIEVVAAPDSMAPDGNVIPLQWIVPDDPFTNTSQPVGARIFSTSNSGVRSWIVDFQLEAGGRVIPPTDTTQIFLVNESGRPSYADTTDLNGRASRRVRLRIAPGLVPPDSAIITISASYKGTPLKRSPVRVVLPLSPG
jgi:hypothetical protein